MIKKTLRDIESLSQGEGLGEEFYDMEVKGVSIDSRKIVPGNLFVPIVGDRFDGHKFIRDAVDNGAVASLWQKDIPRPDIDLPLILVDDSLKAIQTLSKNYRDSLSKLRVIGITGSNGKTSTKDIMDGILSTNYKTQKTLGNLNNHLGVPLTLLSLEEDTEVAIVEMGTDGFGQIELLTQLASPDMAMITNIGPSHLDLLKTKDNVARAKFEILDGLKKDGVFIYNGDDIILNRIIAEYNIGQEVISFGEGPTNDFRVELVSESSKGIEFNLIEDGLSHRLKLDMLGRHNIYNAAASIVVARRLDISYDDIQKGLYNINPTEMRNEIIKREDLTILNDAYKSNPNSLLAALNTLYSIEGYENKAVVLGDMLDLGDGIVELHREIGPKIDPKKIDQIFTIGDLGREIGEAAKVNFDKDRIYHSATKEELVESIKENLIKGSLVLVKASRSVALETVIRELTE